MESKSTKSQYEILGIFLVLELIVFTSFSLGGVNIVIHYAAIIIALVALYFASQNFSKDDLKPVLLIGAPLLIMSIFTSFGKFFEGRDFTENLGAFLAIPAFFAIGLAFRRIKTHSSRNLIFCIGAGLALLTLVGIFSTWIQYGFFYPLIYKDTPSYYYDGNLYSITNEMNWLIGFKFFEVSQQYGGLFGVLCSCFLPGVLFISYKKDKVSFIFFITVGAIGLISLITIPNLLALIIVLVVYGVATFYRFLRNNSLAVKIVAYALLVVAGIVLVAIIFAILNVASPEIGKVIASNPILNRIFNTNKYMITGNLVIEATLKPFNFFGIDAVGYHDGFGLKDEFFTNVGVFEIEVMREGGIFAFAMLLVAIVCAYMSFSNYLAKSTDKDYVKVILLALVVGMFIYSTFFSDVYPLVHEEGAYLPFTRSLPFMLLLFIIGYTVLPAGKSEIEYKDDVVTVKKEHKVIDEDYEFSDVVEEEIV